jgi:NIMA (never in mitosis gene a)-related kinase 1/4/5
MEYADSGDLFQ